jgi:hypothetical protein
MCLVMGRPEDRSTYPLIATLKGFEMDWISVTDRLPETDMPVLVSERSGWDDSDCGVLSLAIYKGGKFMVDDPQREYVATPTHWMPIPEPPKYSATDTAKR